VLGLLLVQMSVQMSLLSALWHQPERPEATERVTRKPFPKCPCLCALLRLQVLGRLLVPMSVQMSGLSALWHQE
jgi:hypothetical protein